jgi:hypothetical protein
MRRVHVPDHRVRIDDAQGSSSRRYPSLSTVLPCRRRYCEDQGVDGARFDSDNHALHSRHRSGKRGAISVLSEYQRRHCRKIVTNEKRQILQPAAIR